MKQDQVLKIITGLCFFLFFTGCTNTDSVKDQNKENIAKVELVVPSFNPDSAFLYVKKQVDFGPRVPNTSAHDKCADWLVNELKQYMDTVIVQEFKTRVFNGKVLDGKNIIGSIHPGKGNRILLSSHWDTRPFADQDSVRKNEAIDGANDGASGVGVLIEIARQLAITKPDLGVDIIFYDIEDYGQPENSGYPEMEDSYALGTQYWAKNLHTPNYFARFGILLDMVGASHAIFTQEGTSMQYAPEIVNLVWNTASSIGYSDYFPFEKTNSIIDDHYYINGLASIKCIDIIHYDYTTRSKFWKHWHTHGDSIDKIDPVTLKVVGQTLLQVLFKEASGS
jgi:glutaminyl-peptide cyclotransferase